MANRFIIGMLSIWALGLSGCTMWPPQGTGGLANLEFDRSQMKIWENTESNRIALGNEIDSGAEKLEHLKSLGGSTCFPALYDAAKLRETLLIREFTAELYVDALNGMDEFHRLLSGLQLNLGYIKDPNNCTGRETLAGKRDTVLIKKLNR